jgi:hypothetical protein
MKVMFGAIAAAMLIGAVWAQPAEARCWFDGFRTVCVHHGYGYGGWHHRWNRGWDRGWHRGWDRW